MAKLYNLAGMSTPTTGTGTITLGFALDGLLTFADAGVQDGDVITYAINDGDNSEMGIGTYTASGTTLARTTIYKSTNGGSAISLSGSAQVFITAAAEDFVLTRTKRVVTSGSATEVLFSGVDIPTDCDDLEIRVRSRGTKSANDTAVHVQFNGDTGNNYNFTQAFIGATGSVQAAETITTSSLRIGIIPAANATSGHSGIVIADVGNYRDTTLNKPVVGRAAYAISNSSGGTFNHPTGGIWRSNAAITSVRVFPDSNGFVDGGVVSLYGRR
jgi:hypothetical protein